MNKKWFIGQTLTGNRIGRTIGFPTINIRNADILNGEKLGVYASLVSFGNKTYKSALFFGPRLVLKENKNVIEVFLLDVSLKEKVPSIIQFRLLAYIRPPQTFSSLEKLKRQLQKDCENARSLLHSASI